MNEIKVMNPLAILWHRINSWIIVTQLSQRREKDCALVKEQLAQQRRNSQI